MKNKKKIGILEKTEVFVVCLWPHHPPLLPPTSGYWRVASRQVMAATNNIQELGGQAAQRPFVMIRKKNETSFCGRNARKRKEDGRDGGLGFHVRTGEWGGHGYAWSVGRTGKIQKRIPLFFFRSPSLIRQEGCHFILFVFFLRMFFNWWLFSLYRMLLQVPTQKLRTYWKIDSRGEGYREILTLTSFPTCTVKIYTIGRVGIFLYLLCVCVCHFLFESFPVWIFFFFLLILKTFSRTGDLLIESEHFTLAFRFAFGVEIVSCPFAPLSAMKIKETAPSSAYLFLVIWFLSVAFV